VSSCRELDADELKKMGVEDAKNQNTILTKRPVSLPSLLFTGRENNDYKTSMIPDQDSLRGLLFY